MQLLHVSLHVPLVSLFTKKLKVDLVTQGYNAYAFENQRITEIDCHK